jgi:hypothetical protein
MVTRGGWEVMSLSQVGMCPLKLRFCYYDQRKDLMYRYSSLCHRYIRREEDTTDHWDHQHWRDK